MKQLRRYLAGLVLAALALPVVASADNGTTALRVSIAYEQLTVSSTAKLFTSTVYAPADGLGAADLAVLCIEDDAVRYRVDGTAPTATVGMKIAADQCVSIYGSLNIVKFRMIRVTTDAEANIHYYRLGAQ